MSSRSRASSRRRTLQASILILPAMALISIFFIAPLILLVVMSFYRWPLLGDVKFAGLENFELLLSDHALFSALGFTLRFTAILVPSSLLVSYITAVLVRTKARGTAFFRTSFFLPVAVGFTAAAYMASVLLIPGAGVINQILAAVHLTDGSTAWFSETGTAFWAIVVITIWKTMGVAMILMMAGMQAVPRDLYEAGKLDGATWLQRERWITLPLIKRHVALCLLLAVAGTLLTFDQFYVLTKGGPAGSTVTVVMFNFAQSFVRYKLGYGAAISLLVSLIILALTIVQMRSFRTKESGA